MKKYLLALFFGLFLLVSAEAQPNSDCNNAIFVCQSSYTQLNSPAGEGNQQELNWGTNNSCLQSNENFTTWYIFTVAVSGLLEFTIQPLDTTEDYDFILFDITGLSCTDIPPGIAPDIRCNFASLTPGGSSTTGLQSGFVFTSAGAGDPPFCAPLNVTTNETYALVVDHFTGFLGSGGYTINFGGTAVVFDSIPPSLVSADSIICQPTDTVVITLSEPVLCSSLAADGSDFNIAGPQALNITSAEADDCLSGGTFTPTVRLILSQPLSTNGSYTISVQQGTDGDVLLDNCGNEMGFQNTTLIAQDILSADFSFNIIQDCVADTVRFTDLSQGTIANYNWDFGDLNSSGLQNPDHIYADTGTYIVTLTVSNPACSNSTQDTVTLTSYTFANFTFTPSIICEGTPVNFDGTDPNAVAWSWDFGDAQTGNGVSVSNTFSSAGNYVVTLVATDNLGCFDTTTQTLTVRPSPVASFSPALGGICQGESLTLNDASTPTPTSWDWDLDGQTGTNGSPNITITATSPGISTISLTVVDSFCGSASYSETLEVTGIPQVDLGNDTSICPSGRVNLSSGFQNAISTWSTGETTTNISVTQAPIQVSVDVELNGCTGTDDIFIDLRASDCAPDFVPSAFSPNGDGVNDAFTVFIQNVESYEIRIFNRWGEVLYYSTDVSELNRPGAGWNGFIDEESAPMSTYTYMITGTYINGEKLTKSGSVTLLK